MDLNTNITPSMVEAMESRVFMSATAASVIDPGPPVVMPPTVDMLVVTQQPTTAGTGQTLGQITVEIFDTAGNLDTQDHSDVTLAGNGLVGTTTVAAQQGVAVFSDLKLDNAGSQILTASDGDLTSASTRPIVVSNTVTAGQHIASMTVNPSTLFSKSAAQSKWLKVKLVNDLTGKTALTRTFYDKQDHPVVVNNLAAFIAGDYDVVASDSVGDTATLEQVTVTPAAPHELWFSDQPKVLDADAVVTVSVLDQYGNLTTQADGNFITLHSWLPKGTAGAAPVLSGNTSVAVTDGMASFTGLTMNQTGQAHLIARLENLKPTVSNTFRAGATLDLWPGDGSAS